MTSVQRNARLFRVGQYPGKGRNGSTLVVTTDDLKRMAANTESAPLIFAHRETGERLDFGSIKNFRVDGDELHATLYLDVEAAPFVDKVGLKSLSAGFPFDMNKVQEGSFTRMPHIADMGMFSQATQVHSEDMAYFSLTDDTDDAFLDTIIATFAGKTISSASEEKINAAHDALATLHPSCCPATAPVTMSDTSGERKSKPMNIWEKIFGTATPTIEQKAEFHNAVKDALPAPIDNTAQFAKIDSRLEETIRRAREREAKAFVTELFSQGKIIAEGGKSLVQVQADLMAQFCRAAEDDDALPRKVTFSVGSDTTEGTRVQALEAQWQNKEVKAPLGELMSLDGKYALFNRDSTKKTQSEIDADRETSYNKALQYSSLSNETGK